MQRSFIVLENSLHPFLLTHYIVRFVTVDEFSVSLALHEIALSTQAVFLLEEMSVLHIHVPSAFVYLLAAFVYVPSVAMLLSVAEGALERITICVGYPSLPVDLVVVEAANVLEGISAFAESQPALSFFLASHKFSLIDVTVAVFQHSFSVELSTLELTLVGLILVYILSSSNFLILSKLSLVNRSIGLFEHSVSLLLAMNKMSLILCIILEVLQFSESMELISVELSIVLRDSLQEVLSLALLHALQEASLVAHAGIGFESSSLEVIILELSCKLIAIGKVKLTIAAMFLAVDHSSLEL